jgi:KUP system potassium uptake protein
MHHMACTHVLHEKVIFLSVIIEDQPHVPSAERLDCEDLGHGIMRMRVHYGFSQPPNIPLALKLGEHIGIPVDIESVIYILGHEILVAYREIPGLPYWQERLFVLLARNSLHATDYYRLPDDRVLELGLQVGL